MLLIQLYLSMCKYNCINSMLGKKLMLFSNLEGVFAVPMMQDGSHWGGGSTPSLHEGSFGLALG